ncbi:MAG: iron-sulfur binding hydrogenase [Candidatus Atribacteria bacterium]|jgi:serine kinase of HPr protein (carbohydrate metabolism regulator)|nr:iron-sulfur binding hydrogenase [Candidatus Atribacteria bacterium]
MKLSQIVQSCNLNEIVFCSNDEIKAGYCGDLMSDVIGHAESESIWITVQAHKNSIAVALIKGIRAIVFSNDVVVDQELTDKAKEEGINLYSSDKNSFQLCGMIYKLLEDDKNQA